MIKNQYTTSEELVKDMYMLMTGEYFGKMRKFCGILAIACAILYFIIQISQIRGIFFGAAIALLIVFALVPKMRNARVNSAVKTMTDSYEKLYHGFPTYEIRVNPDADQLKVFINGEQANKFKLSSYNGFYKNDKMVIIEFSETDYILTTADGFTQGDMKSLLKALGIN